MWLCREQVPSPSQTANAGGKKMHINITVHICRGDLPVKTFILTLNYNLISHYRHKKFTAHHIAAGHGHKLSLIFTFDVAKQMILIWGWTCAAEEGGEAARTESRRRRKRQQRLIPPPPHTHSSNSPPGRPGLLLQTLLLIWVLEIGQNKCLTASRWRRSPGIWSQWLKTWCFNQTHLFTHRSICTANKIYMPSAL